MPRWRNPLRAALGLRPLGQRQEFSGNGTFTVPSGVSRVWLTGVGAGGGGGGGLWDGSTTQQHGGAGGSAEVGWRIPVSVAGLTTVAVTIGTPGTAGVNAIAAGDVAGGNGSATTFGGLASFAGGSGGARGTTGGAGGARGGRAVALAFMQLLADTLRLHTSGLEGYWFFGLAGQNGQTVDNDGPRGGAPSFYSVEAAATVNTSPAGYGAGGRGGRLDTNASIAPAAGQAGFLVVEW